MQKYHSTHQGSIYHANCLDLMKTMDDGCVDLIITSPPYENLREYGKGKDYTFTFDEFFRIVPELKRVLRDGGVCVWIVNDAVIGGSESGASFRQALYFMECGFRLHDTMIYAKDNCPFPDQTRYQQQFEYMFIFSKGKPATFNPIKEKKTEFRPRHTSTFRQKDGSVKTETINSSDGYKIKSNVWLFGTGFGKSAKHKFIFEHPAIFPEQLAADHIKSWSNKGDLVFDPFGGSGTVGVAAVITNRKYILCDIHEPYCRIAAKRIDLETNQLNIFR